MREIICRCPQTQKHTLDQVMTILSSNSKQLPFLHWSPEYRISTKVVGHMVQPEIANIRTNALSPCFVVDDKENSFLPLCSSFKSIMEVYGLDPKKLKFWCNIVVV